MSLQVNAENFDKEVLQSEVPVLVDFWAPWCGPCQMMGPIVDELTPVYEGKAKLVKINVDEAGELSQKFGVMSIPTFIMFKGGEKVDTLIGGVAKDSLVAFIEKHIS